MRLEKLFNDDFQKTLRFEIFFRIWKTFFWILQIFWGCPLSASVDRGLNAVNAATAEDSVPSALEEHRRIFGYRPPVGSVQRAQSSTSRGKWGGGIPYYILRNTWARSFVCLAKKDSRSAPSACERIALSAAGLGEKKIVFHKSGDSTHVHEKITEAFPALASAGGYEILQIADDKSKNLMEIPMSGLNSSFRRIWLSDEFR